MFNFSEVSLERIAVHHIGNKVQEEELRLSDTELSLHDEVTQELLLQYFLSPFKQEALYQFQHETDLNLNEVYHYAETVFENPHSFLPQSQNIAKHLYERTNHPNIKTGEMYLVYFENCLLGDESCNAIGIFKSETKDTYLKVYPKSSSYEIDHDSGINIKKLDKGCLIFDVDSELGFRVAIVDKTNKNDEAHYWKDHFLGLKQREDSYYHTDNFMKICKGFVDNVFNPSHNVERTEQIEMLNRSVNYLTNSDAYDTESFQEQVMGGHPEVVEAFNEYKEQYANDNEIPTYDEFDISPNAVKASKKLFKSILKLDKNFHVYIHGKRDHIEKGFDEEKNLKYYKLYFREEK